MNNVGYIKSFSKGQVTIPKEVRDELGIGEDFWLKIVIENGKLIAEPVTEAKNNSSYLQTLSSINGQWIKPEELKENRKVIEKRLASSKS